MRREDAKKMTFFHPLHINHAWYGILKQKMSVTKIYYIIFIHMFIVFMLCGLFHFTVGLLTNVCLLEMQLLSNFITECDLTPLFNNSDYFFWLLLSWSVSVPFNAATFILVDLKHFYCLETLKGFLKFRLP